MTDHHYSFEHVRFNLFTNELLRVLPMIRHVFLLLHDYLVSSSLLNHLTHSCALISSLLKFSFSSSYDRVNISLSRVNIRNGSSPFACIEWQNMEELS